MTTIPRLVREVLLNALDVYREECGVDGVGIARSWVHKHTVDDAAQPDSNSNSVDHPKHYNAHPSGVECITIVRHMSFNIGNVIKYLWRAGLKDSVSDLEDLKKARWYLDDEIKQREATQNASQV